MSDVMYKDAHEHSERDSQPNVIKRVLPELLDIRRGELVAIKFHPGDYGNTTHVRPVVIRAIVDVVKEEGGEPFLTESTVLYKSKRFDGRGVVEVAAMNGFTHASMGAPFIVADGIRGDDGVVVEVGGKEIDEVEVASACAKADYMIVVSHGKGHPASGFGGAVKHLGMGCLTKSGKRKVHVVCQPVVDVEKCTGCGKCVEACPWDAIHVVNQKAEIDREKCAGEMSCASACPEGAISEPAGSREKMQMRLGEASLAPIKVLNKNITYINWVYQITAGCDCFKFSNTPMTEDVGILFSHDPVAIDCATIDLINEKMFLHEYQNVNKLRDKLEGVWEVSPWIHIESAEKLGAGSSKYVLTKI
jgi:hypothetical protein